MYGHSSASGANLDPKAPDPLQLFEDHLLKADVLKEKEMTDLYKKYNEQSIKVTEQVRKEADPSKESLWDHVYYGNENANWRFF